MSVKRVETKVDCLDINKGGFVLMEETIVKTGLTHLSCTIVLGSNWYNYQAGVLVDIRSESKELELCDIEASKVKYDLIIKNFREGKYPVSVTTYRTYDYHTIHPDHISCSSLLLAAKLRQLHPDKTIYFDGKEYPKLIN